MTRSGVPTPAITRAAIDWTGAMSAATRGASARAAAAPARASVRAAAPSTAFGIVPIPRPRGGHLVRKGRRA